MTETKNEAEIDFMEKVLEEAPLPEEAPEVAANKLAPKDFMQSLKRRLPQGQAAMSGASNPLLRPRQVTFVFDGSEGLPSFFMDEDGNYLDVELTVRSLSSFEESDALRDLTKDTIATAPSALAKRSLYAVAGRPLDSDERDLIWEGLGAAGRQLVLMAYQNFGGASEAAMGKYLSSFTVS